jgi:hypothetical protein
MEPIMYARAPQVFLVMLNPMSVADETRARRLQVGCAPSPEAFPEDEVGYQQMSPAERIAALRRLSRRVFEIKLVHESGERGHSGLPDRLVGGRC